MPAASDPSRTAFSLGDLRFEVEHRRVGGADGGPTLRVRDAGGGERLRFDCFRFQPHYHLCDAAGAHLRDAAGAHLRDAAGAHLRDEASPHGFGPVPDPVAWVIGQLRDDLPGYLARAGLPDTGPFDPQELGRTLHAVELALRNPPARFDDLDPALLHTRLSEKWHTYPAEIHPAWVAEMDFPLAEPVRVVLERAVDRFDVGYPIAPHETGLREAFCERMQRLYGWDTKPARVEVLTDVVQGLYLGLLAWSAPGDGAVIQTPIYPPFFDAVRETGRRLIEHRLQPRDTPRGHGSGDDRPGYALDVDPLRERTDERTRVLLLCNPHNPTGRVFRRDELEAVAALAHERDWVVVVDEIHQDLVFPPDRHIPFATLSEDAAARTVTLTSATKAFNIPGLRTAVAHFGSSDLQRRFNAAVPRHVRGGIGLLGLYATIAAWRWGDPWLGELRTHLAANRDLMLAFLAQELPEVRCQPPEATYLAWLDFRALGLEPSPARFFYERAAVALSEGRKFGPGWEGFARLNFATSRSLLVELLEKLAKAVRSR